MKNSLYRIVGGTRRPLWLLLLLLIPGWSLAQTNISADVQIHAGGGKMAEYGSLTFNAGYVITPRSSPNDNLSFRPGSSYTGAKNASHVNGYAEVVGSSAFTFPIGNGQIYRPAGISAPPTSGTFQAAYFDVDPNVATLPTGAPFSRTAIGPGLASIIEYEYWDINGPSAVNITLGVIVPADGGINLTVVGWDGTKWVDLGGTVNGGASSITTTTPVIPDTYTAFAVGRKIPPPPTVSISGPAAGTSITNTNPPITGIATIGSSVTVTGGPGSSGGPCVVSPNPFTGAWTCTSLTFTTGLQTVTAISGNSGGRSTPATRSFSVTAPNANTGTACGIAVHGPNGIQVHTNGDMAVYCDVNFIDGYVTTPRPTPNDNIAFMPGTGHIDASDDSHVDGYAEKVGNTAFVFPVGDGTSLRPVGMSAPATVGSTLQAAYFSTNPSSATQPTGAPFSTASVGTGVTAVSPVEYWDVNGSEAVDLTFTWNPASNLNTLTGSTLSNLIMVGWDGARWVDLGSPTTTGTLSGTGTLKVTGITPNTYTAYTFGAKGAVTPPTASTSCGIVIHGPTNVEVHPTGTMVVYCDVTFISGDVNTPRNLPNNNIVFMPGTGWFDASDGSHVNGYTEKVGNTAFVFPVGDGTTLRPVGMSAPATVGSTLQAAYFSTNPSSATQPTGAPFSTASVGTGVTAVSPVEYWDVNGSEAVDLTFTWNPASNLNTLTGSTLSNLIMVGWDGAKWVDLGSPTTTGTLSGTGTLKVAGITPNTYTAYTFGAKSVPPSCPNPSVGGTVVFGGTQPLCSTANTGTLMLTGQTGNVLRWETSTDNGATWSPITNTTTSLVFNNVANNQQYRAVVNNGGSCADATASAVTLTTSAAACGGGGSAVACGFKAAVITR